MRWRFSRRTFIGSVGSGLAGILLACSSRLGSRPADSDLARAASSATSLDDAITAAADFLGRQYDSGVGLLREAPQVAPNRYWLLNDNAVATLALGLVGKSDLALQVKSVLGQHGVLVADDPVGIPLAVLWGKTVEWPPRAYKCWRLDGGQFEPYDPSATCSEPWCGQIVCYERWDGEGRFDDWGQYANLTALGALNEQNRGRPDEARLIFADLMRAFDGEGFRDKAFHAPDNEYETFKLALALYVGLRLRALSPSARDTLAEALLGKQHAADGSSQSGGLHTHYTATELRGDVNTETTSLAIIALNEYRADRDRSRIYLPLVASGPPPDAGPPLAAVFAPWYGYDFADGSCHPDRYDGYQGTHWGNTSENPWATLYRPTKGYYCSADPAVVKWQLDHLESMGVSALFVSWWGWGDANLDGSPKSDLTAPPDNDRARHDSYLNQGIRALLDEIRARHSPIRVAFIVEPFPETQSGQGDVPARSLRTAPLNSDEQATIRDWLWGKYYDEYRDLMFEWDGKPLLIAFDPLRMDEVDSPYAIRNCRAARRPLPPARAGSGSSRRQSTRASRRETSSRNCLTMASPSSTRASRRST